MCNGCGMPTDDAYSSGHLVLYHFGTGSVLMLRPFSSEVMIFPDLSFEHPSVLLLCFTPGIRPNASGAATVSPDGKQD